MYFVERVNLNNSIERDELVEFLSLFGIDYEPCDCSVVVRDEGVIKATASRDGSILKYFYCDENYLGQGLMLMMYNELLDDLFANNILSYFVFTKPLNEKLFTSMNLRKIASTKDVLFLEGGMNSYYDWISSVKSMLGNIENKKIGAIVANCNPMTLGHKYLFDYASKQVDMLIIFVVEEDRSQFTFSNRFAIVKNEMSRYKNVVVLPSGPYIISSATFPTYFLKKADSHLKIFTELDITTFARIASDLGISKRFVGEEPYDEVTAAYNLAMKNILPAFGIEVEVLERKKLGKNVISASKVRGMLAKGEECKDYLPQSTIDFLKIKEKDI